jgi:drug/metabolite transporter (DMT)-like permease
VARDQRRRLLRRGSVPLVVHGLLEYGIGVLLIASSSLFSFDSTPRAVAILLGAAVLVVTALSDMPTALMRRLPLGYHIVIDLVVGVLLIASPFIFGFSDATGPLAFFLALGLAYLFLTAVTRFHRHEEG